MKINFNIMPSDDTDDYYEIYTAVLQMPGNVEVTVTATDNDVSYGEFRADVLEDILRSLCQSVGMDFEIEVDDYAIDFEPDEERGTILQFPRLVAPELTAEDFGETRPDGC
jgi:hypothetical protein